MTSTTTATAPSPTPSIRVVDGPVFFFFLPGAPSSSSRRLLPFLAGAALPVAGFLLVAPLRPPRAGPSSRVSPSTSGPSPTKRYLHFGEPIFLPLKVGARAGTVPSHL